MGLTWYFLNAIHTAVSANIVNILPTDQFITSALVRQGIIPCSPISPSMGITTNVLEFYHVANLRSPHLSIQAFVKTLCDLHTVGLAYINHYIHWANNILIGSVSATSVSPILNCIWLLPCYTCQHRCTCTGCTWAGLTRLAPQTCLPGMHIQA